MGKIKSLMMSFVVVVILAFPVTREVSIIKSQIKSVKPISCQVNGYYVGSELTIKYYMDKKSIPDTLNVIVTRPLILGSLGFTYKIEEI